MPARAWPTCPSRVIVGRPVTFAGGAPERGAGAGALRDRLRAAGLHRDPLRLRAGRRGLLLRPRAGPRRHRAGRRLRRRHLATSRSSASSARPARSAPSRWAAPASAWRATPSTTGSSTTWSRRRSARASSYTELRQDPADPQPLLFGLRPLGPAGPDARQPRHARDPRAWSARPSSRRRSPAWSRCWTRTTATSSTARSRG